MTAGGLTKLLGAVAMGVAMVWASGAKASLVLEAQSPFTRAGDVITAPANGTTAIVRLKANDSFPPDPGSVGSLSLTLSIGLVQLPPGLIFDPAWVIPGGAEENPFGWPFYSANATPGAFVADFYPWSPGPGSDPEIVDGTNLFAFEFGFAPEAAGLIVEITGSLVGWADLPGEVEAAVFELPATRLEVLAIPEPATLALLVSGLLALIAVSRRRLPSRSKVRLHR